MSDRYPSPNPARQFWSLYEPIHAICYFEPTFAATLADGGLTGWWNGYFAGRAAPLGPGTPSQVVTALFFGFSPTMVARAIPKVWTRIEPETVLQIRLEASQSVLAGAAAQGSLDDLRRITTELERCVDALRFDGRALAAAWASVARPASMLSRLWLAATVLREHRGDGHVAAATASGLTGFELAITHIASGAIPRHVIAENRGWTEEEWDAATRSLVSARVIDEVGALTDHGAALRAQIETCTDDTAAEGRRLLDDSSSRRTLTALVRALFDRGAVPVPNPMGVPALPAD